jgi:eukaryotic-like serine/threonine-protein kinase
LALSAGTRLGTYEIVALLGAGGMGEVYRARDTRLNREVAIKILPEALAADGAARARLEREAQTVAALSHPNILGIFDFGLEDRVPFAVMELLEGVTLRELLREGPVGPRKVIEYGQQIAAGLGAAHASGITHRDLKPENVFVTRDGRVKILDFGLAKVGLVTGTELSPPSKRDTSLGLTGAGTIVGTVGYMAPEQVRGRAVDHRSDIFSFGAILYELLAGRRAFTGESAVETMNATLKDEPAELPRTNATPPLALESIVRRCLEKHPDDRFQSARDVAFAFEAISTTDGRASLSGAAVPSSARTRLPKTTAWRIAAVTVLTFAVGVAGFIGGSRQGPRLAPGLTRLTFDSGTLHAARFAPDGHTVVYGAAWGGQPIKMFQTRLGSPESTPLQIPDAELLALAPSGEIALALGLRYRGWIGEGMLARAPLVGGTPREMFDHVRAADWSPDGSELAIVRRIDGRDRLEYPAGTTLFETPGYISHPRVSPKGTAVAFLEHPVFADNRGWVAIVTRDGQKKQLTQEWSEADGLAWSLDGQEVWFTASSTGRNLLLGVTIAGTIRQVWSAPADITLLDISADGRALVATNALRSSLTWTTADDPRERNVSWFSWTEPNDISPDGRTILLTRYDEGAGLDYKFGLRRVDEPGAVLLGAGQPTQLSPDGKWVLTHTFVKPSLTVVPTGAGERQSLTTTGFRYITDGWFPDGQRVLFIGSHGDEPAAAYEQDLNGAPPHRVAVAPMSIETTFGLHISPDRKWFFGVQSAGPPTVVPIGGGQPRALPGLGEGDIPAAWLADGRGMVIARRSADQSAISIVRYDLASARIDPIRQITVSDPTGIFGVDVLVTPDGRTVVYNVGRLFNDLYLVEGLK